MRAYVIVDLGFGDAGKGLLTDFLAGQAQADLVVRYNGGAQAGHNVVTGDGRHHTFSQFGSASFHPQVKTYLSRYVVIHPTALLVEGDLLMQKAVADPFSRLRISDRALVITPFHQAANRLRERARGTARHGSCGVGVGEAVEDALLHPDDRVWAADLSRPALLRRKLQAIRERKRAEMRALCEASSYDPRLDRDYELFDRDDVIDNWLACLSRFNDLGMVVDDEVLEHWLQASQNVVFEGAQGVLLDGEAGFHPYTTWSDCTSAQALEILRQYAPDAEVFRIGLLRSYAVRHGPGPLPTETDALIGNISEHNRHNDWQGAVRYGWFDAVLARYALQVTGSVDTLAITHMDAVPRQDSWQYCPGYQDLAKPTFDFPAFGGLVTRFGLPPTLSLEERAEFTQSLFRVTPVVEGCAAEEKAVIQKIESLLEQPIGLFSRGPRAGDVQLLSPL